MAEVSSDPAFICQDHLARHRADGTRPKDFAAFIKSEVETNTKLLSDAGYSRVMLPIERRQKHAWPAGPLETSSSRWCGAGQRCR